MREPHPLALVLGGGDIKDDEESTARGVAAGSLELLNACDGSMENQPL